MLTQNRKEKIIIIDFGSQVTKLIARRVRDLGVYSEILTPKELSKITNFSSIKGVIFSGGPSSVTKSKYQKFLNISFLNKYQYLEYVTDSTYGKNIRWKN